MDEVFFKELDMLQSCISRKAESSFRIKGWAIAVFVAVLGLLPSRFDPRFVAIAGSLIVLMFWIMDASYLQQERLYRLKYQWVIKNRQKSESFVFDLNCGNPNTWDIEDGQEKYKYFKSAMLSWSESLTYCPMIAFYLIWALFLIGKF